MSALTTVIPSRLSLVALFTTIALQAHANDDKTIEHIEVIYKRSSVISEITEDAQKLVEMPGAMGDPLRAAFALPGVVAAGGSMGAPAVRGSSPDDNLFEVDFMPAGYIFHDFGSSIFNRNTIQDFQMNSAGFGTSYSNATGAVFDVTLRNPKYQDISTTIDVSMFNAGAFVEGQLSDSTAFYLSGRKSTLPLFFDDGEELEDEDGKPTGIVLNDPPDDHDYQGKFLWDLNSNNSITFNFNGAEDTVAAGFKNNSDLALKTPEYQGDAKYIREFNSQSILWDHYGKDLHIRAGVGSLSNKATMRYGQRATISDGYYEIFEDEQLSYKARVNYRINKQHRIIADLGYYDKDSTYKYDAFQYICTEFDPDCDLNKGDRIKGKIDIATDSAFLGVNHVWQISDNWQSEIGLHAEHYDYSDEDFVHPRMALSYFVDQDTTIVAKAGRYSRMQDMQYIVPELGNPNLKAQRSDHFTVGFNQSLSDEWSYSVEGYYKTMDDLPKSSATGINYINGTKGNAYGVDIIINKNKTDNWYGWVAISLAKSEREDEITGVKKDYYADTPFILNAVLQYDINEKWSGGFNFTARSGQAYTPIVGVRENPNFENRFLPVYGDPFSERFDTYHRLDIRFERKTQVFGLDGKLVLELMNAYGQDNTAYIDLDYKKVKSINDLYIEEEEDDFEMRPSIGFSVTF
ncbi:TonB-dependent receptor plug domain-containing protein [Pseudoalteromonas sp. T1lg65]|uniref:TonB-dependent receptor plug domain-containing protein n=1 Tax=Pseudoalteromonas sp. T1lg65 TaxID=2077101 RepID=UPI003F7B1C9D